MENVLNGLQPELVFKYFEEISQIPRGSGNEKAISDYLKKFGKRFLCYFLFQHTSRKKVAGGVSARWFIILQIYLYHIR